MTFSFRSAKTLAMHSGREQLAAWIDRSKLTQRQFAPIVGLTEAHLSQILSGKRRPGLPIAVRIEDRTGVPVRSWLPQVIGKTGNKRGKNGKTTRLSGVQSHV